MFLVGIVPDGVRDVLDVEETRPLGGGQRTRAGIGGHDDLRSTGGEGSGVGALFRGHKERSEDVPRGLNFLIPPNLENPVLRPGVDRDDRAHGGLRHPQRGRILIGRLKIVAARLDVAGRRISGGRNQTLPNRRGTIDGRSVRLLKQGAVDRLREKPDIPDGGVGGELQQGAVEPIAGNRNREAPVEDVDRRLSLGRIVLIDDLRDFARGQLQAGRGGAAAGRHQIVHERGKRRRPRERIRILPNGPKDGRGGLSAARRGRELRRTAFEPMEHDTIRIGILLFGVEIPRPVGAQQGAVVNLGLRRGRDRGRPPLVARGVGQGTG